MNPNLRLLVKALLAQRHLSSHYTALNHCQKTDKDMCEVAESLVTIVTKAVHDLQPKYLSESFLQLR
jgi:hypothetical protein